MQRDKRNEVVYRRIADDSGLSVSEVKKAVISFFDIIAIESRKLPFDNPRKIYSARAFGEFGKVYCLPYIGRIGTSHTKYLRWRANESKNENMVPRSTYKKGLTESDVERMAEEALSGRQIKIESKRKQPFRRVWMVDVEGKKQARQVIPKDKDNV